MIVFGIALALIGCCCLGQQANDNAPGSVVTFPAGDIRNCPTSQDGEKGGGGGGVRVQRFEVLPGSGWDNLRNVETGMVLALNYTLCRTTDDQRFLIPDYINVYPVKTSRVDSYAEIVTSYQDYQSVTSRSVNANAGFLGLFGISGTFSDDYTYTKEKQLEYDTLTTRVQERYVRYRAVLQPDMTLDPAFKFRLLTIAASLELYNTRQARFDAQQLVREFGTHVTTSVDAGAVLVMEEQVSSYIRHIKTFTDHALKAAARFSFLSQVGNFWAGASYDSKDQKSFNSLYMQNRTESLIRAIGGNVANRTNFTRQQWTDMIDHDLVAIDRSGEPIYNFITAQSLPEIPASLLVQLSTLVREAVTVYYKMNTYPGCTDRTAENFNSGANVDDGSCDPPSIANLTFGGVFQSCNNSATKAGDLCSKLRQTNPLTGDFSCPNGYEAIPLHTGTEKRMVVEHKCGHCWLIFGHCCHDETLTSVSTYQTSWCMAWPDHKEVRDTGYMFGGLYTAHVPNLATSDFHCPHAFVALKVGQDLRVCVSDQFTLAVEHQVPLGGFFSCQAGNPLALGTGSGALSAHMYTAGPAHWPKKCPRGYSQYLAEITPGDGCEISYCMVASALKKAKLPTIRRPPFLHVPFKQPSPSNQFVFDVAANLWQVNEQVKNESGGTWAGHPASGDFLSGSGNVGHFRNTNGNRMWNQGSRENQFIADSDSFVAGIVFLVILEVSVMVIGASILVCAKILRRKGGRRRCDGGFFGGGEKSANAFRRLEE